MLRYPADLPQYGESRVANIKQQKKRNRRSLKQRDTNIRYRSTVRSGMKRLSTAAAEGEAITPEQAAEMMKTIDRAAARGAMHKNTAARRKARVARLAAKSAARPNPGVRHLTVPRASRDAGLSA